MKRNSLLKNVIVTAGLVSGVGLMQATAQETILASGGDATGSGGSASYSIGQVFYTAHQHPEGTITEGVQQPYEISVVIGLDEADNMALDYSAYPNPVTGFLILKVEQSGNRNLLYQLIDNNGRLLKSERITSDEYTILMEQYVAGTYYLNVLLDGKWMKTFKIIKY